jgi:hypothetical protein
MNKLSVYLNSWTAIENLFRIRGYILEGYNPDRDVYERVYKVGPVKITRDVHTFTKSTKPRIVAKPVSILEVTRPGGVSMTFKGTVDLARRLHKLTEQKGYKEYPEAPFLMVNKDTGTYSWIPAHFAEQARMVA